MGEEGAMKSVGFFSQIFEGVGGSPKFGCTSQQLNLLMHQNSLTSTKKFGGPVGIPILSQWGFTYP